MYIMWDDAHMVIVCNPEIFALTPNWLRVLIPKVATILFMGKSP